MPGLPHTFASHTYTSNFIHDIIPQPYKNTEIVKSLEARLKASLPF